VKPLLSNKLRGGDGAVTAPSAVAGSRPIPALSLPRDATAPNRSPDQHGQGMSGGTASAPWPFPQIQAQAKFHIVG
jgi:hypothetical protein